MSNPLISAAELQARLGDPSLVVLDCRFDLLKPDAGRRQWRDAHIPGARYADLDRDLAAPAGPTTGRHPLPDAGTLAASFGRLGVGDDSAVVVYDAGSGAIAARAWWLLRWLGHNSVQLLERGFAGWRADERPVESGEVAAQPALLTPRPQPEWILDTDEVLRTGAAALRLIDARDPARFRGEHEPIDPVAGHVPGAQNLPFEDLLTEDGRFAAAAELRERFRTLLPDDGVSGWAVMCGSGVTACHLAIAAELAGLTPPRLYAGSFSEWIRDPERPVGVGPAAESAST